MSLLKPNGLRTANVLTLVFCEFHVLSRDHVEEIWTEHHELKNALEQIARQRMSEAKKKHVQKQISERLMLVAGKSASSSTSQVPSPSPPARMDVASGDWTLEFIGFF